MPATKYKQQTALVWLLISQRLNASIAAKVLNTFALKTALLAVLAVHNKEGK